jgi:hypothetical protein
LENHSVTGLNFSVHLSEIIWRCDFLKVHFPSSRILIGFLGKGLS